MSLYCIKTEKSWINTGFYFRSSKTFVTFKKYSFYYKYYYGYDLKHPMPLVLGIEA